MTVYSSEAPRQGLVHQYPVVVFFLLAYAFSWTIGGFLIADYQGVLRVPGALHYVSAFGPMVAAIVVTALIGGRPGLLDLWRRSTRTSVGWRWWLIGAGTPVALGVTAIAVFWLSNGVLPDLALFGEVDYLGAIGVLAALVLWIATYGFGEEVGWRGFAFHRMESGGWVQAAIMIGVLWGLWHLPYFFYKANFIVLGIGGCFGYLISITLGSILLSWMYRGSGRSILLVALWHGLFDFVSASPIAEGVGNALISSVVIVWVIVILRLAGRARAST